MLIYKNYKLITLFCLLVSEHAICSEKAEKWLPQIDLNIKYGNKRSIGRIGALAPIKQTNDKLAFVDFRFMADTREDQEGNFGLGQRWLNSKMEYIVGAYGYFDRRFSNLGNKYNQLTFGAEYLSLSWDYRANVYIPENKVFKKQTTHTEVTRSSLGDAQIIEVIDYKHIQKEVPLRGIDVELGRSMPGLPSLRLYTGAYYYQGRSGVSSIQGYQLRSNYNLNDYVSLQGEAKRDNIRKTNYYLGVELRIPIGKESHKNHNLTMIEKRMVEAPIRDVDIVANVNESKSVEKKEVTTVATETPEPEPTGLGAGGSAYCFFKLSEAGIPQSTRKKRRNTTDSSHKNSSASGKTSSISSNNPAVHVHSAHCSHSSMRNTQSTRIATPQRAQATTGQKGNTHVHSAHCGHSHSVQQKNNHSLSRTSFQNIQTRAENKTISTHHDHANCGHNHSNHNAKNKLDISSSHARKAQKEEESSTIHTVHAKYKQRDNSQSENKHLHSAVSQYNPKRKITKRDKKHQHDSSCEHHHKSQDENEMEEEDSSMPTKTTDIF